MIKPIHIPRRITREFIIAHPQYHFLYSSAYQCDYGHGQSGICRGLGNASRIPVRFTLCSSSGYFSDNIKGIRLFIKDALAIAVFAAEGKPIIPFPRMGEGKSRMSEFAMMHHKFMRDEIDNIKWGNIVWQ